MFSHQFARNTDNLEIKQALALSRRVDAQQQKVVNGLNPGDQTPLETTIGYEQVAVDLTSWLARHEPDPMLKQALDFALLEDFDHLYRYANLYELLDGKDATELTDSLTEITPGRPTVVEHRHPHDDVRGHYETHTVDPLSRMHVMTIVAAEQQTMNFYMNHGADWIEPIARGLYAEIALIEEQHVTHYESLLDPLDSWLKQLVFHEYNEVYLYWSMLQNEDDTRIARSGNCTSTWRSASSTPPATCCAATRASSPRRSSRRTAGHPGDVRAEQGLRARDPRHPGRPARRRPRLRARRRPPDDHRSRRYRDIVNAGGAPSERSSTRTVPAAVTSSGTRQKANTPSPNCGPDPARRQRPRDPRRAVAGGHRSDRGRGRRCRRRSCPQFRRGDDRVMTRTNLVARSSTITALAARRPRQRGDGR